MIRIIFNVVKNSAKVSKSSYVKPVGRWSWKKNNNQQDNWIDWSTVDNCGVCDKHLAKIRTKKSNRPDFF